MHGFILAIKTYVKKILKFPERDSNARRSWQNRICILICVIIIQDIESGTITLLAKAKHLWSQSEKNKHFKHI